MMEASLHVFFLSYALLIRLNLHKPEKEMLGISSRLPTKETSQSWGGGQVESQKTLQNSAGETVKELTKILFSDLSIASVWLLAARAKQN